MATLCPLCTAPITCVICESCEAHCLSGGAARCLAFHEDWLRGGAGGIASAGCIVRPAHPEAMRAALARAVEELARS